MKEGRETFCIKDALACAPRAARIIQSGHKATHVHRFAYVTACLRPLLPFPHSVNMLVATIPHCKLSKIFQNLHSRSIVMSHAVTSTCFGYPVFIKTPPCKWSYTYSNNCRYRRRGYKLHFTENKMLENYYTCISIQLAPYSNGDI